MFSRAWMQSTPGTPATELPPHFATLCELLKWFPWLPWGQGSWPSPVFRTQCIQDILMWPVNVFYCTFLCCNTSVIIFQPLTPKPSSAYYPPLAIFLRKVCSKNGSFFLDSKVSKVVGTNCVQPIKCKNAASSVLIKHIRKHGQTQARCLKLAFPTIVVSVELFQIHLHFELT